MVNVTTATAAILSTVLISLAPNLILFLFPNYVNGGADVSSSTFLQLGQALAAGSLLGDVFLHTIPHSSGSEDFGIWILVGFVVFFVVDLVIRSVDGGHGCHGGGGDHTSNGTSNGNHHHHVHEKKPSETSSSSKSSIILNLAADALHNFTDGLSIGASFAAVRFGPDATFWHILASRGGLATLSVLCHEIPHELGDFCTLVRAGYSTRQAIRAQFGTALAALLGTVVALLLEGVLGDTLVLITAGGFVYLAATTILPEVLNQGSSARFRVAQLVAFLVGVAFLYAVAILEHHDHHHHDHGGHSHGGHNHHHHHHHDGHHDHGDHRHDYDHHHHDAVNEAEL